MQKPERCSQNLAGCHIASSSQTVAQLATDRDYLLILYSAHRPWHGLRWIVITGLYCIQLTDGHFVCKPFASFQESDILWTIENSRLWDWNLFAILYPAHKQLLGLRQITTIRESDNVSTIDDNIGDSLPSRGTPATVREYLRI
jgi:hypothetical protein